jgi:hypothetical protein
MVRKALELSPLQCYLERLHAEMLQLEAGEVAAIQPGFRQGGPDLFSGINSDPRFEERGEQIMKVTTLLLSATIALGAGLSDNVLAGGDYGRGHGWGDHGRHSHHQDRHHHRHGHHRKHHHRHHYYPKHHHRHRHHNHYLYRPRPYVYRAPSHHSDGWYGIQLFLGGDL